MCFAIHPRLASRSARGDDRPYRMIYIRIIAPYLERMNKIKDLKRQLSTGM